MSWYTCDWQRARLNLRLAVPPENAERWRHCGEVHQSMLLAEAALVLKQMQRHKAALRFNVSNHTKKQRHWQVQLRNARRWWSIGERMLRKLLVERSLFEHFKPGKASVAAFFHAADLVNSVRNVLPLLESSVVQRLKKSQSEDDFWGKLESHLHDDVPLELVPPKGPDCSLLSALPSLFSAERLRFQAGSNWALSNWAGQAIKDSLDLAQQELACMMKDGGVFRHFAFRRSATFFHFLDRLDCPLVAAIKTGSARFSGQIFWMHVMPAAHTESDHVRGKGEFHCGGKAFRDFIKNVSVKFRFVEVGASLGGCSFKVLTSIPSSVALAIEPYGPAAEAMRRTAVENGLTGRLSVVEAFISSRAGKCLQLQRASHAHEWVNGAGDENCKTAQLLEILKGWSPHPVDLLRIHVNGFEMDVITSALAYLEKIRVMAIALWTFRDFPVDYDPSAIASLLVAAGCRLELHYIAAQAASNLHLPHEAVIDALQRKEIQTPDTMTLMAFCGEKELKKPVCCICWNSAWPRRAYFSKEATLVTLAQAWFVKNKVPRNRK